MVDRVNFAVVTDLGAPAGGEWRFRIVDRDVIDELPGKLGVVVDISTPDAERLAITHFDDLSPDGLAARVPALARLLEARAAGPERARKILEEAGFAAELKWLDGAGGAEPDGEAPPPPPVTDADSGRDLLDSILEDQTSREKTPGSPQENIARWIREVGASARSVDSVAEGYLLAVIDGVLGDRVRAVLADPAFRRVEAAWRSLRGLVMSAETGEELGIAVLPAREAEIREDLAAAAEGSGSRLERALDQALDGALAGSPPAALFLDLEFGAGPGDLKALEGLAAVGHRAGCPALAAALPGLAGAPGAAELADAGAIEAALSSPALEGWRKLRSTPPAGSMGLCLPRVLLRPPYGPRTLSVEAFRFDEESSGEPKYLWGSSVLLLARVLAAAAVEGRLAGPFPVAEISRLPVHIRREDDGEPVIRGPLEVNLNDEALRALRGAGLIPIAALRGRDAALFPCIQSAAGGDLFY